MILVTLNLQEKSLYTQGNAVPRPNTPQNVVICSLDDITPETQCENSLDFTRHEYSVCVCVCVYVCVCVCVLVCVCLHTHIFLFSHFLYLVVLGLIVAATVGDGVTL